MFLFKVDSYQVLLPPCQGRYILAQSSLSDLPASAEVHNDIFSSYFVQSFVSIALICPKFNHHFNWYVYLHIILNWTHEGHCEWQIFWWMTKHLKFGWTDNVQNASMCASGVSNWSSSSPLACYLSLLLLISNCLA